MPSLQFPSRLVHIIRIRIVREFSSKCSATCALQSRVDTGIRLHLWGELKGCTFRWGGNQAILLARLPIRDLESSVHPMVKILVGKVRTTRFSCFVLMSGL